MILSSTEARAILERALSYVKADEAEVSLSGGTQGNLRYACNRPTTTGSLSSLSLGITCVVGKRVGSYSTTDMSEEGLRSAIVHAEAAASLAPESPEYMPRLGAQTYHPVNQYDAATATSGPLPRTKIAAGSIKAAEAKGLQAAGYWEDGEGFTAFANNKGGFGYHRSTNANYTLTVRTKDGSGSGWAAGESYRASAIDTKSITARAVAKALGTQKPQLIEPGAYTVILEPSAAGDMLNLFHNSLDRRSADEGRSFYSAANGSTKLNEKLFGDSITIYSDPTDPLAPSLPWGDDGLPLERTMWVEGGVLKNLYCGRYWADQKHQQPVPYGSNIIMQGGSSTMEEMIASTERGLLITSFWYIREVDPQTILHTGLTRDGVFLIEKGKITMPVLNLRWNESPATVLKGIELMSKPERVVTREGNQPMLVPAMKVKEFHFTSVSYST